jgi:hypothetical protein
VQLKHLLKNLASATSLTLIAIEIGPHFELLIPKLPIAAWALNVKMGKIVPMGFNAEIKCAITLPRWL